MKVIKALLFLSCLANGQTLFSQSNIQQPTSINQNGAAPNFSAILDLQATDKGLLVPRLTTAQRMIMPVFAQGLLVYDTDTNKFMYYTTDVGWVEIPRPFTAGVGIQITGSQISNTGDTNPSDDLNIGSAAGGDLTGTFPNPTIAANAIGSAEISNGSITAADLSSMGAAHGQIMRWDDDIPNWVPVSSINSLLQDTDADTRVHVEANPDEDIIRFSLGGTESMVLLKNAGGSPRLELPNSLNNTFVGLEAGNDNTTGIQNTAHGSGALRFNTTGFNNTAIGHDALNKNTAGVRNVASGVAALVDNTTGSENTAVGFVALYKNITGSKNTAIGFETLRNNTTGFDNVANGYQALWSNTTGYSNIAIGTAALLQNTDRSNLVAVGDSALFNNGIGASENFHATFNTALGSKALFANTTGYYNTANGRLALYSNTTGYANTANGSVALSSNTTGNYNTANGSFALSSNTTGNYNTATGYASLGVNTTGSFNTVLGVEAMSQNQSGSSNTALGTEALKGNTTGFSNTAVGVLAADQGTNNTLCVALGSDTDVGTAASSYSNAISIGYDCNTTANNYARIGNTSVTSIGGQVGWSNYSDGRFKRSVQENVPGLDFITRLRPVTYLWDIHALNDFVPNADEESVEWPSKYDIEQIRFTGFIAQEVQQAAQEIDFDFSGVDKPQNEFTPYALRYAEFVVPLVKAVQEQQAIIEHQNEEIGALKAALQASKTQLEQQAATLEKITTALRGLGVEWDR